MKFLYVMHRYDVFIFTWLINFKGYDYLTHFAKSISRTADGHLYVLLGLFLYFIEGADSLFLKVLGIAFLIERPIYFVLKNSFKRNRPSVALNNFTSLVTPSDQFSFPSGHTSAAAMVSVVSGFFLPDILISLLIWSALVGFSRVAVGVHFPTDTLMGFLLGVSIALISLNLIVV